MSDKLLHDHDLSGRCSLFRVWNADSADTGGLLGMGDWRTIQWQRLDLLSSKLQLMPYYKFARCALVKEAQAKEHECA